MLLVLGKGGKERLVPILPVAIEAIRDNAAVMTRFMTPDEAIEIANAAQVQVEAVTIDAPIVFAIDAAWGGGAVYRKEPDGRIHDVGVGAGGRASRVLDGLAAFPQERTVRTGGAGDGRPSRGNPAPASRRRSGRSTRRG